MATATAYSAYTNLIGGAEDSSGMSAVSEQVDPVITTFAVNCFNIPQGSKINSVTIRFQAKLSRNNTSLYAGRWGFRRFQHYERWDGYYPGYNALQEKVKNGEIDKIKDYDSNARQHETAKLSNSYKEYSFKISDWFNFTEKMLSGGFEILLNKIYQGTLSATIYIKDYRVEVDYTPPAQYYLDLNGYIDGASSGGISPAGTADVYIGGTLVSNDCTDYYTQHYAGTAYEIKDIKASPGYRYVGVKNGSLSGTITGNTAVVLEFEKLPPEIMSVRMEYNSIQVSKLNKVPVGEGFLISVQAK